MVSLLIFCLFVLLVCGVACYIVRLLPLPAPRGNVAVAIIALIGLLIVLSRLAPLAGIH